MKSIAILLLLLVAATVHAGSVYQAAFLRYTIGSSLSSSTNARSNIASVSTVGTGTYSVVLTNGCPQSLGVVNFAASRADGSCFADFSATNQIAVTCRRATDNTLVDIPAGTIIVMTAYCGEP